MPRQPRQAEYRFFCPVYCKAEVLEALIATGARLVAVAPSPQPDQPGPEVPIFYWIHYRAPVAKRGFYEGVCEGVKAACKAQYDGRVQQPEDEAPPF